MQLDALYNNDAAVAAFDVEQSMVQSFIPLRPEFLSKQPCQATPGGFTLWLQERASGLMGI